MEYRTKQRVVKVGLVILAIWPLIHIGVVHSTGLSPWRGFGWAMYTVPVLKVDVGVRHLEGDVGQPTRKGTDRVVQSLKRYVKRYQALGANA